METMRRAAWALSAFLAVGVVGVLASCRHTPPKSVPEARETSAPITPAPTVRPTPAPTPREGVLSEDLATLNRRGYLKDAFFDYDKTNLRDDARSSLAEAADWLKRYPSVQILIEGHCDERGTSEYNLALGDRRANAAGEYLASLGVEGSRIKAISYGKERPFCTQSTETCWQENRRAHLVITAK
jgi:peptidoglycan-associated lipoprotein